MRTLVIHVGGLGDFLLACPAIARLARETPVELLGRRDRLELAVAGGLAAAAHDLASVGFDSVFAGMPAPELVRFLGRFNRAVVWMRNAAPIEAAMAASGVGDVRAFPGLPPDDWRAHASTYYLSCIGECAEIPCRLAITPSGTRRDVIIHPGSGGKRKNWPLERFLSLASSLRGRGLCVSWLTGPAESDLPLPGAEPRLVREDLLDAARCLAGARLYVGNDSGITHLAAAVGCPTVAIFGPTDPRVWAPQGDRVQVVAGRPWPDVAAVESAGIELLNAKCSE